MAFGCAKRTRLVRDLFQGDRLGAPHDARRRHKHLRGIALAVSKQGTKLASTGGANRRSMYRHGSRDEAL